jgi:hypothetical protein
MASAVAPGASTNGNGKKYADLPDGRFVFKITAVSDVMGRSFQGNPAQKQWRFRTEVPDEYHDRIENPDRPAGYEQGSVCSIYTTQTWGFPDKQTNEWKHSNASTLATNCLGPRATEADLMPVLQAFYANRTLMSPDVLVDMLVEGDIATRAKANANYTPGGDEPEEIRVASLKAKNTRYLADMIEANRDLFHRHLRDFNAPAYDALFPNGKPTLGRASAKKATTPAPDTTTEKLVWEE